MAIRDENFDVSECYHTTVDSNKSKTLKTLTALTKHVFDTADITELPTSLNSFGAVWTT